MQFLSNKQNFHPQLDKYYLKSYFLFILSTISLNPYPKSLILFDYIKRNQQGVFKVPKNCFEYFKAYTSINQLNIICFISTYILSDLKLINAQMVGRDGGVVIGLSLDRNNQQSYNWMGSKNSKSILYEQACFSHKGMIKRTSILDPSLHYTFLKCLGEGSYSKVFLVQSKATGQLQALKKISKGSGHKADRHLINEFEILRQMDHPNIIKMFQMFEDDLHFYIITEYLEGNDTLQLLHTEKEISQEVAFSIFYQTLLAINYCHKHHVMHRDLKLENILFNKITKSLKLLDFGSALKFQEKSPKERRCTGTIYYLAPEMINKYYNYQCDIWSLGIILYVLLSGNAPFLASNHQVVMEKILNQPLNFANPIWNHRSDSVKKLIACMLEKNFEKRIQIAEIMKNSWVLYYKDKSKIYKPEKQAISCCLENMQKFARLKIGEIEQGILIFLINSVVKLGNLFGYMKSFQRLDTKEDGQIDEEQIKWGLITFLDYPQKKAAQLAHELMTSLDFDSSGKITYSQFLTASSDLKEVLKSENLQKAFDFIDIDSSNGISVNELRKRLGDHIGEQYYSILIKNFKTNQQGEVMSMISRFVLRNLVEQCRDFLKIIDCSGGVVRQFR